MKIALAGDHAGFTLKDEIKRLLEGQSHTIEDFGATSEAAVDLQITFILLRWRWAKDVPIGAFSSMGSATGVP